MTVVSLLSIILPRHLFPSSVFLQKKIKRLILIDGICSGQWFYRVVSYKANLRIRKAAWMASATNLPWLTPNAHQRNRPEWYFEVQLHQLFSSGSLRNDAEEHKNILSFLINAFLRNSFLTAQRDWKIRQTSVPPCPLTAAHSPLGRT